MSTWPRQFNNGVFNVGQVFITDYVGTALKMTVKDLELPHIGEDAQTGGGSSSDGVTSAGGARCAEFGDDGVGGGQ